MFQGIVTAVQEPDSFPKTLPYHQMTGKLTVKEMLHEEQENHEAMSHCIESQAAGRLQMKNRLLCKH